MAMDTDQSSQQNTALRCVMFTYNTRMQGYARTSHVRLTDLLNTPEPDFVLLQNVEVLPLGSGESERISAASVLIRKENVIFALPLDETAPPREVSSGGAALLQREARHATLGIGPFTIDGTLHLVPGADLLQHVRESSWPYLAVTDVTVGYRSDTSSRFKAPFVVINRSWIDALMEGAKFSAGPSQQGNQSSPQPGQPTIGESSTPTRPGYVVDNNGDAEERPIISGDETAEVLFASQIFKETDVNLLKQAATELSGTGGITRHAVPTGSEVFRHGEMGDSLYVVESGQLEVIAPDRSTGEFRRIAMLGPGDLFGEMAILGEGKRTATVRALSESSLLALSTNAWKFLSSRFPATTTNLLRIMVQRRGPRGGLFRPS